MSTMTSKSKKKSQNPAKAIPSVSKKQAVLQKKTAVNLNNPSLAQISHLQRTVGNQAIQRAIQRTVIQRKMTVGPVGDKYEQEADTVAKQVVNNLQTSEIQPKEAETAQRQEEEDDLQMKPISSISPIQRQENEDELQAKSVAQRQEDEDELQAKGNTMLDGGEVSHDTESAVQSAKSGGNPMDTATRAPMESAFNTNFRDVKIHTDAQSHLLNENLQAKAFTTGQDIFFRQGAYNPTQSAGKELLAHELTHVVQQTGNIQRKTSNMTAPQYSSGFKFARKGSAYKQIKTAVTNYNGMGGDSFDNYAKHLNTLSSINALITKWIASYGGRKKKKKNDANKKQELETLANAVDIEVIAVQTQIHDELTLIQANSYSGQESLQKLQTAAVALRGLAPDVQVGLAIWIGMIPGLITTAESRLEDVSGKFTDDNVTKSKDEAVGGGLNKLDYIKYNFGLHRTGVGGDKVDPGGGSFEGYFQADVDEDPAFGHHRGRFTGLPKNNPEFGKRSRAVYELSKLLDTSLIPPTFLAQHKGKMGAIMEKVDGRTGHDLHDDIRNGDFQSILATEIVGRADYRRALSNLYLFDVIAGQVDRHGGNYIVVMEGRVIKGIKGIDNDLAFGKDYDFDRFNAENAERKENNEFSFVAGKMPSELNEIDLDFARKIIDLAQNKQEAVRSALTDFITDKEITATLVRLGKLANFLQQLINTNDGVLKAEWH